MQKINDDDVVSCSPTSVSSGYCSQWMSPYAYGSSSKQSASERTICTESEFESDHGVNQKFLTEFHSISSKTRRGRSKLLPSGVQVTKRKLTCARQHRKSVQHESEVLKCPSVQSDLASFPHKQTVVQSSSPDLPLRGLAESCLKRYSLNSGHAYKSDKLLASEKPSLSGKRSKRGKNCLTSLGACKSVRYLTVSICRLPSGIKSIDVKNIRNSSCYFQNTKQVLDFKDKHRRTANSFKQLQSSRDIRQVQSNSNCKQLQPCSYLKPLYSQSLKQHTSKSKRDVKHAKLNQNKILMGVERHHQSKNDVNHLRLNKCKDSLHEADIEEDHRKVTEVKQSGGVLQNSRSVFVKDNHVESYKCNVERMQYAVFTKTNSQNPVSLCKASDLNRPLKKTLNHEQCSVKVTHTTYRSKGRSKVFENQLSNCVSTSGFCSIKNKLDSHVSADGCRSVFSSVMHDRKPRDTLENWIKTKHSRRKVKCGITGRSDCRCRRCHWRPCHSAFRRFHQPTPVLCKHVSPRACYKQGSRKSTETHPNGVLANEADETLSSHNSPHIIDIQNEREVRPGRRNLFETFLKEIPSTSQQNLTEEIASKPEMSAIQNSSSSSSSSSSGSHLNSCVRLDYSAKDLDLCEPSDPSVQPRTENSSLTELFEPSAPLLDTNDDMYSDISDDVLPDAVSTTYDMFSDISDCIPDDIPVNESTNGDASSDMSKNIILPDLYSLWLQSRCFNPLTSSMSLESIKTNPIESHNERSQETPQTPEDSSCSDNRNHILNCQKPCSTAIANNPPVSNNRCHTEIQTNNSSPRRPCSFIVTAISEGLHCFEIEEDDSLCKRCSCSDIQTLEASSPSERHCCFMGNQISEIPCSAESMTDSSQGEKPCSLGVNPATAPFTSDSVGPFSTNVQERSSPTSPGAAEESMAASREPCSNKEQRFHSCGVPCSNEIQTGISPLNSLDMSQKSEMFTSKGLCSTESDETMLNSTVHYFSTVESTNEGSVAPRLQEETTSSSSIQDESAFGLQSSVEIPERTLTCEIPERTLACEEPCHLLETQRRLSITKEIVCVQNKSPICEHSSTEIRGKVFTTPCSVATQKGVSISENTVSIQLQNELLAVGSRNMLETIHNLDGLWLNNVSKENLTYEGPSEFDVSDEGILRSGDALVVGISFSEEEGPVVSEICDAKEGHSVLGATYSEEDSLVSDETCFKDGPLTSKGSCCKVGPLASEVILEDSSSRGELLISEEPSCNERPLVSEEPVSNTGPYMSDLTTVSDLSWIKEGRSTPEATCSDHITESPCLDVILKDILTPEAKFSDASNEGSVIPLEVSGFNVLQSELTGGPWEGFSSVQEFEDLLTAGVGSCLSETNDGSVNLEDLFPFVLQAPSQVFAEPLNYEDYLSCEMHKNTPVESQINSTQENSLIAESSSTATFQEEFANPEIRKDLLISGNSSSKDSQESNSNEINSNHLDTSSKPESFLAKFHEFTNAWRPSAAASESENDADNRHHDDAIDSLDETRNECISDANRTSCGTDPFISAVTIPQCSARAKTESWLREYQSQMLENQQRKHKNWQLLVSVIDDRKPGGRRGGQQRSASGNRSRKRNCSPRTNKTRHQPKKFCSIDSVTSTCNSEQTEPKEDFLVLQNDVCNVDLTSHLNFSVDGVMATFQNMVLNGDPSVLSRFIDQANTWLSVENTETTIDQEQFGHSGPNIHSEPESTTPLSRFTSDSGATLGVAPEQPEGTMPIELPGLALNSETSTDAQSVSMLSVDYGNIESVNVLSSDPGNVLQTVVPGFTGVGSELDPEMLQNLLSMILQSDSSELLPGISYSQSNEAVTNTDVNRGIIYVLNHPNSVTQFVDCSQIVNCDPAQDCNKHKTGSQCQIEDQTFTPVLLLSNGNDMSTKVTNPTNTQDSDSGADISQNSSEATRAVLSEGESQPAQSNCPVMDIDEFRTNNIASATSLEQQHIADVVESNSAVLLEKHNILFESQHQNSNALLLEKNCEISNNSGGSSAPLTDDHIHQNSVVILPEIDCTSGTVLVERNSELHRDEHSKTGLAKGLPLQSCSDSMSAYPLQNDPTDENNNSEGVLPTGNQLLSHQNCGIEQLSDSCWVSQSTGANGASYVDQQGASGSEHKGSDADLCQRSMDSEEEPSSKDDGLSVGEDSLSDKSDPFVLTCEDAGDNAAIFLEEAEDNFSETSEVDLIMLGCNDSHESDQQNDSETAPFNVATSSPQVQSPSEEQNSNASKDHGVPAVVLLEGNQHSFKNGKQRSKSFDEIIQKNSEDVHKKSSDVVIEKSSKEGCRKSSSKDACRALRSFRCEEAVITKVVGANLATFSATNDSGVSPNCRPMVLCPHGSALILADKLTSEENSKVKTKLKKSKPTRNAKTKASSAVESQGLHVTPPDIIAQNRNGNDKTISSGGVTELSLNRSKEKSEGNFKKSRLRETSHSGMETVEPAEVNSSTEHTRTLKNCRSGIKLRIVKVRRGVWKAQRSTDPATQQHCSQKEKSVASASNDDCIAAAASENLSTNPDGIYISDESDTDSQDCFCIDESCLPNHRLRTSPNRTIINQMTTSTRLHRFGCTCVTCAEQQFLYGRDNTMSLFTDVNLTRDISLRRALMRYKQRFMPANRSPSSQVCSVTPIVQSPVVIDDLDGSNSEMPIHIS